MEEKAKSYEIIKTKNGFIIEFLHQGKYYNDENKAVAKDLTEVVEIIDKDLREKIK